MSYGWREIDGVSVEVCDECGFDTRAVHDEEIAFAGVFAALADLVQRGDAHRKPSAEVFSAQEYVDHCVEVTEAILGYVTDRLDTERHSCPDLAAARDAVATMLPTLTAAERATVIEDVYPWPVTVQWVLSHLLHDLAHHVLDIRRGYAGFVLADSEGATSRR
ncbi:DinB family protein [Nocardioides pelophilus]|uniref:DinB family protein n=1 Tax=Nocardioides pelophilus TaxID=2172019 RepID=UPI0016031609|nr:DinB family protein [Nocardioides pelophilus]